MLDRKTRLVASFFIAALSCSVNRADTITNDGTLTDPVINSGTNTFLNNGTITAPVFNQDQATFENRATGVVGYVENTSAAYFNNQGLVSSVFVNRDFATLLNTGEITQIDNYSLAPIYNRGKITRSLFNYGIGAATVDTFGSVSEHAFNYSFGSIHNNGRIHGHAFNDGLGRFHNAGIASQNAYNNGGGTFENTGTISGHAYNSGSGYFDNKAAIHGSVYNYNASTFTNNGSGSIVKGDVYNDSHATFVHGSKIVGSVYNDATFAITQQTAANPTIIQGDYFQSGAGNLVFSISSENALETKLAITGTANFAGTITVTRNNLDPAVGSRYPLISYKSVNGHFATFNGSIIDDDRFFGLDYQDSKLDLITLQTPRRVGAKGPAGRLTDSDASSANLVLITHGAYSDTKEWATRMATAFANRKELSQDWTIATVDWQPYAKLPAMPSEIARRAHQIGDSLANWMREQNLAYDHVHAIGHSAGSWLVNSFGDSLLASGQAAYVHDTFLDAYVPPGGIQDAGQADPVLGKYASFADHYVDRRLVPGTNETLEYAANVEVTQRDPAFAWPLPINRVVHDHGWPYEWYIQSIENPTDPGLYATGYVRTFEYLGFNPTPKPPVGERLVLPFRINDNVPTVRWDSTIPISPSIVPFVSSSEADVSVTPTEIQLNAHSIKGSPESASDDPTGQATTVTLFVPLDQSTDSLRLQFQFEGGASGFLSVFFDGINIVQYDQRFLAEASYFSGDLWLGDIYEPGTHTLLFRLDPYDGFDSEIALSSIEFGVVLPEPISTPLTLTVIICFSCRLPQRAQTPQQQLHGF